MINRGDLLLQLCKMFSHSCFDVFYLIYCICSKFQSFFVFCIIVSLCHMLSFFLNQTVISGFLVLDVIEFDKTQAGRSS